METNTEVIQGTEQTERTFTQAELNAIVQERVGETKAKYGDYEELKAKASKYDEQVEASKSELQKATERADSLQAELNALKSANEVRALREKVAKDKNIPANLLTGETEEDCIAQADAILSFAMPNAYPAVKDGGEVRKTMKKDTASQFKDWFNEVI